MALHLRGPGHPAVVVTPGEPGFSRETGSIWLIVYPTCTVPIVYIMVLSEISFLIRLVWVKGFGINLFFVLVESSHQPPQRNLITDPNRSML